MFLSSEEISHRKKKKMSYKLRMKCLKNKLQKVYCQHGASSEKSVNVCMSCLTNLTMQGLLKVNFHGIDHGCSILAASKPAMVTNK